MGAGSPQLAGLPGGRGVNIAHEAIDRHASSQRRNHWRPALARQNGPGAEFTYIDLRDLHAGSRICCKPRCDIGAKDRVFVFAGSAPELYIAALGNLKIRSVFCPLFSAFGPEPIRARLSSAMPKSWSPRRRCYERKIAPLLPRAPGPSNMFCSSARTGPADQLPGTRDLARLCLMPGCFTPFSPPTPKTWRCSTSRAARPARPKARCTSMAAVVAHHITGKFALDLHPERHLLVHRRSRLGHRDVLRHHRAADESA